MNIKVIDKGQKPVEWMRFVIEGKEVTTALDKNANSIISTKCNPVRRI